MAANFPPQKTDFSLDVLGRFTCNTVEEAVRSTWTSIDSDARPFDYIIVGGGSFGSVLASHLFQKDATRSHRILVLEAGPIVLPEHVQNLPPGYAVDGLGQDKIWGVPWNSNSPASWNQAFPGLAFCLGGRSLFWGGWSPRLIDSELDSRFWPANVKRDLTSPVLRVGDAFVSYLDEAADQIGTSATNDYIFGPLHATLADRLVKGLPGAPKTTAANLLGNVGQVPKVSHDYEAPLAVQSASSRPGFFPMNKFNGIQLLLRAARLAESEAEQSGVGSLEQLSAKKRLMIVDNVKVTSLENSNGQITRVFTNQGPIDVAAGAKVILALGTIENTRLALETLPNSRGLIGRNLMAHLRSNLTIRIPKPSLATLDQLLSTLAELATNLSDATFPDFSAKVTELNATKVASFAGHFVDEVNAAIGHVAAIHVTSAHDHALPAWRAKFDVLEARFAALKSKLKELQVSALFVKGVHTFTPGNATDGIEKGHFHLQITASGVGQLATDSEAELFKKIPNIDEIERFADLDDQWIVVTLRGIGEMFGDKLNAAPMNRIILDRLGPQGPFDYGQPRALVRLDVDAKHLELWNEMDKAARDVALVFGAGAPIEYLNKVDGVTFWSKDPPPVSVVRDTLSSTHHEGGTLWMGTDSATSVTDELGAFWEATNLHAVGPALQPTMGSPNPMLTGVALTRRIGDGLLRESLAARRPEITVVQKRGVTVDDTGFVPLFDGTQGTYASWVPVGLGAFALIDGNISVQPGGDIGLLYYAKEAFQDFTLRLEFNLQSLDDNSGVFIRFRDPRRPLPLRNGTSVVYQNQPFVGVDTGFEVQIDEKARGNQLKGEPDGMDKKRTGALYDIPTDPSSGFFQNYSRPIPLLPGDWNLYEIQVTGNDFRILLNNNLVTTYKNTDAYRGRGKSATDPTTGFLGLQSHTGRTKFRNIRIKRLAPATIAPALGPTPTPNGPSGGPTPTVPLSAAPPRRR